jgi:hypothetical protein
VQELMMSFADVEGEPELPPQLYADNIGCFRWEGAGRHDIDYKPTSSVAEYYQHTLGYLTIEPDKRQTPYITWVSEGKVKVAERDYWLVPPCAVIYNEKLRHVIDGVTTCVQTLNAEILDPWDYESPNYHGIRLPNAGWGLPRQVGGGLELIVHLPYVTQGTTCPGTYLDHISVPVAGALSADGKSILLHEEGSLPEGMGTFLIVVNFQALRQ